MYLSTHNDKYPMQGRTTECTVQYANIVRSKAIPTVYELGWGQGWGWQGKGGVGWGWQGKGGTRWGWQGKGGVE